MVQGQPRPKPKSVKLTAENMKGILTFPDNRKVGFCKRMKQKAIFFLKNRVTPVFFQRSAG